MMNDINGRFAHLNRNLYSSFHLHLLNHETRQQVWKGLLLHPPVAKEADLAIKQNNSILSSSKEVQLLKTIQSVMASDFPEMRSDYGIVTLVKQVLSYFQHRHQIIIRSKHIALVMPLLHIFTEFRSAKTMPQFISFLFVVMIQIAPLFTPDMSQLNERQFQLYHRDQTTQILEQFLKKDDNELYLHIVDTIFEFSPPDRSEIASRMPSRNPSEVTRSAVSRLKPQDPKQLISFLFRDFIEQMSSSFFNLSATCVIWEQTFMMQNIQKQDMLKLLVLALRKVKRPLMQTKTPQLFVSTFKSELKELSEYEVFLLYQEFIAKRKPEVSPFTIKGLDQMKALFTGLQEIIQKEQRERLINERMKNELPNQRRTNKKLEDNAPQELFSAVLKETLERRKQSVIPAPDSSPKSLLPKITDLPEKKRSIISQEIIQEKDEEEKSTSRPSSVAKNVSKEEKGEQNPGNKRSIISIAPNRLKVDIFSTFDDFI